MNNEQHDSQAALREIAAEVRRLRQAVLIGLAVICFIAGLQMLFHPNFLFAMVACFVAATGFLFWAAAKSIGRLGRAMFEEARRQHSSGHTLPKGQHDTRAA